MSYIHDNSNQRFESLGDFLLEMDDEHQKRQKASQMNFFKNAI